MNEKEYIEYFKKHIKDNYKLPEETKIALYQNPKDFKMIFLEDINPNHIKIVYGRRWDNCSNYEKIARIIIPSVVLSEMFTLSLLLTPLYYNLFGLSFIVGIYLSDIHKIFIKLDRFIEGFENGICRKHHNGYIRK